MRDYVRRVLIAVIIGLCVSLLFLGGKHSDESMTDVKKTYDRHILYNS
jgi:hypothetical protein